MQREWHPAELIECWTLLDDDRRLVANKTGVTRLGFALLLKFFELEGRFPRSAAELPASAVDYVAAQVKVPASALDAYQWAGSTIEYHRSQIRAELGFREPTVADEQRLAAWLASEVCPLELGEERVRAALIDRCREERIEPPAPSRAQRVLGTARAGCEQQFTERTVLSYSQRQLSEMRLRNSSGKMYALKSAASTGPRSALAAAKSLASSSCCEYRG